jgi:CYTH domain-containing protein
MEIERKYAVLSLPEDLSKYRRKEIEQGYLCHNPTIRIRKSDDDYILTYKSRISAGNNDKNPALINHEVELPLTKEAYTELRGKVDGRLIYKTRHLIPLGNSLTAELDIFEGNLNGFVMVEVEFPDEITADEFVPPLWFGKELSSDKRFSNYNLSKLNSLDELKL